MLPGMDGLSICQQMKSDPIVRDIPIIIISAKGEESDVVIGLELGADDYLAKPFGPRELLARVKAVLRRGAAQEDQGKERIQIRNLLIDVTRHEVRVNDELCQFHRNGVQDSPSACLSAGAGIHPRATAEQGGWHGGGCG